MLFDGLVMLDGYVTIDAYVMLDGPGMLDAWRMCFGQLSNRPFLHSIGPILASAKSAKRWVECLMRQYVQPGS